MVPVDGDDMRVIDQSADDIGGGRWWCWCSCRARAGSLPKPQRFDIDARTLLEGAGGRGMIGAKIRDHQWGQAT